MAINTRRLALKILVDIDSNKKYSNIALNRHLDKDELSNLDKRFIRQLVYGVLENKIYIDYVIKTFSKTPIRKMNENILNILRLGIYQIKFLDKVPDSAAVNESVKIAKKINFKLSGFVNGILRSYIREPNKVKLPNKKKKPTDYLSIKYSFNKWIVEKWISLYGLEFTEKLLIASNSKPQLNLRTNTLRIDRDALIKKLGAEECISHKGAVEEAIIVDSNSTSIERMESYRDGLFSIQDSSSMLVARVLGPRSDERVLDLCSAPGGKSTHMAQLMNNKGTIIAQDIHEHKLDLINEAATRLGIDIISTKQGDATILNEDYVDGFDKVLVDAPCSGLGIIRRKPEIKYSKTEEDIEALTKIQADILDNAAKYVRPGGALVYSTCTIVPEENNLMIKSFLDEHEDFEIKNIWDDIGNIDIENTEYGIQLYPNTDDTDGFFIAKLIRKSV